MALRVLLAGAYRPAEQAEALVESSESDVVEVQPEVDDEEATAVPVEEA